MASVRGTHEKRFVDLFAALNVMSVVNFWAESKPGRRMIDIGRFFDVERQSSLAELRQNFAPCVSMAIQHRNSFDASPKLNKSASKSRKI
mgnify:CR=1 FL=1